MFDEVADALRGMVPPELGELRYRAHRYGIKAWFGTRDAPREHYEAQVIGKEHVKAAKVLGIEVGFHAEHAKKAENEAVVAHLAAAEKRWRKTVGKEAVIGGFLGRSETWRRVSETWPDPDMSDPELAIEIAACLTDYMTALEPVLRSREEPT